MRHLDKYLYCQVLNFWCESRCPHLDSPSYLFRHMFEPWCLLCWVIWIKTSSIISHFRFRFCFLSFEKEYLRRPGCVDCSMLAFLYYYLSTAIHTMNSRTTHTRQFTHTIGLPRLFKSVMASTPVVRKSCMIKSCAKHFRYYFVFVAAMVLFSFASHARFFFKHSTDLVLFSFASHLRFYWET